MEYFHRKMKDLFRPNESTKVGTETKVGYIGLLVTPQLTYL